MLLFQLFSQIGESTNEETDKLMQGANKLFDMAVEYAPKVLMAILIYIVGQYLIKWVSKLLTKIFKKRHFDPSLQSFLSSIIKVSLIVLLIITVIGVLGVNITSFAALLAGAGLAIGSALNGTLGNFAGGVMILILKPFRIGDIIEAQGFFGIVQEIGISYTTILTSSNQTIHLPNGKLSTGVITNLTDQENLRIDMHFPVADNTDIDLARKVAIEAMKAHPNVIDHPAPDVKVKNIEKEGMVLVLFPRIEIKPYDAQNPRQMEADYYSVFFGVREAVKKAFQKNGIERPATALQVEKK